MSYDKDPATEYEMFWSLFQGSEEEKEVKKEREGVTVKILKFLFGSGDQDEESAEREDDNNYREKRRFHRHVYQPSPRHPSDSASHSNMNGVPESKNGNRKKIEAHSTISPASPEPMYQSLCRLLVAVTFATVLMLLTAATNCIHVIKTLMDKELNPNENVD